MALGRTVLVLVALVGVHGGMTHEGHANEPAAKQPNPGKQLLRETYKFEAPAAQPQQGPSEIPPDEKSDSSTILMERVVVTESKNWNDPAPTIHKRIADEKESAFKAREGGRLGRGKIGTLPYETGIWKYSDLMSEEQDFKALKTLVEYDLLRISL